MIETKSIFSNSWIAKLIQKGSTGSVGEVKASLLTESQFQSQNGTGWVLSDGRDVTGSAFHALTGNTVIPDARGVALRGKNNGRADGNQNPDGDLAIGAFQGDSVQPHNHYYDFTNGGVGAPNTAMLTGSIGDINGTVVIKSTGPNIGTETRMRNITVNYFVKIN